MMTFQTIQIQLIDTPPISPEAYENYLSSLIRIADPVVLVCDLAAEDSPVDLEFVIQKLNEKRILLQPDVSEQPEDPRFCAKRCCLSPSNSPSTARALCRRLSPLLRHVLEGLEAHPQWPVIAVGYPRRPCPRLCCSPRWAGSVRARSSAAARVHASRPRGGSPSLSSWASSWEWVRS